MGFLKKYQRETAPGGFVDLPPGYPSTFVRQLVSRTGYARLDFSVDGGAVSTITPATTWVIPAGALVNFGSVNSTVAVTSAGSATVAIGTSAGSSTTSILTATAKATYSLDACLVASCNATPFKMSVAGSITFTVAVAALTAGVIEVQVEYWIPFNA